MQLIMKLASISFFCLFCNGFQSDKSPFLGRDNKVKHLLSTLSVLKAPVNSKTDIITNSKTDITTRIEKGSQLVKIADSTLRQGDYEQTCQMEPDEKIRVATQLVKLGVDILEVGEPSVSNEISCLIEEIVDAVGAQTDSPVIMALCLAEKESIKVSYEAIQKSTHPRLHLIVSADELYNCVGDDCRIDLMESFVKRVSDAVEYAKELCDDVQFSTEDAFRIARKEEGFHFLKKVYTAAVAAGANTINLEDSYGFCTPKEIKEVISALRHKEEGVKGIEQVTISLSCHDDLGLSTANYLAGVQAGARQLQCTINGIGQRAGTSALEEVVMALKVRAPFYNKYFGREANNTVPLTSITTEEIYKTSKMVSELTGMMVQRNKAIVGENAFAHESGVHQDGVLKHPETYEIISAKDVGVVTDHLVLGKHSGRHAFREHLETKMGLDTKLLRDEQIDNAFKSFKEITDLKKVITEMELEALVNDELYKPKKSRFELSSLQVFLGTNGVSTATITIFDHVERKDKSQTVTGESGIAAAFKALEQITKMKDVVLMNFSLGSKSRTVEAVGEAILHLKCLESQKVFYGRGSHYDVTVAATKSYLNALNRIHSHRTIVTQSFIDLQLAGTRRRSYKQSHNE